MAFYHRLYVTRTHTLLSILWSQHQNRCCVQLIGFIVSIIVVDSVGVVEDYGGFKGTEGPASGPSGRHEG